MENVTLREQIQERERQWRLFHKWESENPPAEREPDRLIADLGAILSMMPHAVQSEDPDPRKLGVQRMHADLEKLRGHDDRP